MITSKEQASAALALRQLAGQVESSEEEIKFTQYFHCVDQHDKDRGGMVVDRLYIGSSIVIHLGGANNAILTECLVKEHTGELSGSARSPETVDRQAIQLYKDGRCDCSCGTIGKCPLGRVGSMLRCTEAELKAAGVEVIPAVPDMIPRVGPPDGYPRLGCGTLAVPGMKIYDKDGGEQTLLYCDQLGGDDNFRCRYAWDKEYSPLIDFTAAPPIQAPTANSLLAECLHVLTKGVQPRMTERWPALKQPVDNLVAKLSLFLDATEHP